MKNLFYVAGTAILFVAMTAQAVAQEIIIFSSDFSGTKPWNFDALVDPSNQVSGVDQFVYSGATTNCSAYLTKNIDGATFFSNETGKLSLKLQLDLSNYPTTNSDFYGPTLIEIATGGNKSTFESSLGRLFSLWFTGYNYPGQFRFYQGLCWLIWSGSTGYTTIRNIGNRPAFPLVYDLESTITVSGNDDDGWLVHAASTLTGPIDASGAIGNLMMTSSFSYTHSSINGLKSITGLRVGCSRGSLAPGATDSIALDNVELKLVPEPATVGLLGCGVLTFARRRR